MDFSTILHFIKENYSTIISACVAAVFLVVNIIQAIRTHDANRLNDALLILPQVISDAEDYWKNVPQFGYKCSDGTILKNTSILKRSYVAAFLKEHYGKLYIKNKKVFEEAIEDILNTPQKKGGLVDVSQTNEEK